MFPKINSPSIPRGHQGELRGSKDVRAGFQRVMQVFINNAANIFLLDADDDAHLQDQVSAWLKIVLVSPGGILFVCIKLYRSLQLYFCTSYCSPFLPL